MRRLLTAILVLAPIAVAGCGGSSASSSISSAASSAASSISSSVSSAATSAASSVSSSASSAVSSAASSAVAGGTLKLAADPSGALKFDTSSLSASAGKVTVDFTNSSPVAHNLTIASSNGSVVGATPTFHGGSKTLSVNLKPGTYTFYCSVPGHRQAGMQGTLVVK